MAFAGYPNLQRAFANGMGRRRCRARQPGDVWACLMADGLLVRLLADPGISSRCGRAYAPVRNRSDARYLHPTRNRSAV